LLAVFRALPGHEFWLDDLTLFDARHVQSSRLLDSGQITDTYLLALASAHGGQFATFDRHIVAEAVIGGPGALYLIQ
jgi:predicted nucleic acid-binding protein